MSKMLIVTGLAIMTISGCYKEATVQTFTGPQGMSGAPGANGHSLVSQYVETSEESLECSYGGTRLDIYMDMDDSLSVSEGDSYSSSLVACNGANGLNGEDGAIGESGPQGEIGPIGLTGPEGAQGPTGPEGPEGPQGETGAEGPSGSGATITTYTASACTSIAGTIYYVKSNGGNAAFYTGSTCNSSTKVEELGDGDSFWVASRKLAVDYGDAGIRVIDFN